MSAGVPWANKATSLIEGRSVITPTYQSWNAAKSRCFSPRNDSYADYGGRGISMCERWATSYDAFVGDMGERPEGTQLDRIDNNGNYEPGNCRWVSVSENCRNRRTTVLLTHEGVTMSRAAWAEKLGIGHRSLRNRIKRGWPLEKALTTTNTQCQFSSK